MALEAVALDLHPLQQTLFAQKGHGAATGTWLSSIPTGLPKRTSQARRWTCTVAKSNPPEGFSDAWTDSLLRMQQFGETVIGLPYHDGPECLIYRKDAL
ncbi:hypothetical protein HS125_08675 [bacterium]|nr:hypothetical protein [bacterium]